MRGQELSMGMSSLPVLVSLQDAELAGFSFTAGLFVHEFRLATSITESLCRTPETNTTLLINYSPI